eukprot:CAMPEP_0116026386 /NCGR_PEP_ID=MMETSP0321-20121206/13801_1 /TAXON_ID=163516 /ORGANISM="Leptocylindrus danicus var. danicus, Strain B650" /LENGTH=474 /DNA_ID=CAMNT_0003499137 /DNA_START=196 /DNA_END=1617 /DNA_ORIENTATION=-
MYRRKTTELRREVSGAIQIIPDVDCIWRGDEHSTISLKIKLAEMFSPHKSTFGKNAIMDAYVQNVITGLVIDGFSKSDLISFQFSTGSDADQPSVAQVFALRNNLCINIHKNLFHAGDQFRVAIEVKDSDPEGKKEVLFGTSSVITVADHILCVSENFSKCCPFVQRLGDSKYGWYSKSKNSGKLGLDTLFCIKDSSNKIIHGPFDAAIVLKAELVYENGLIPPKSVLAPKKSKKSAHISLFKPLSPTPIFDANGRNEYCSFRFRINEVSFHHPEQSAFKIKVSATSSPFPIKAGLLKESIVVLSKPKGGSIAWLQAMASDDEIFGIPPKTPNISARKPRAVPVTASPGVVNLSRVVTEKQATKRKGARSDLERQQAQWQTPSLSPCWSDIDAFPPNKRARVISSEYADAVPAFPVSSCHSLTTVPQVTSSTFQFDQALNNIPEETAEEEVHDEDEICILNAFEKISGRNFQDW